MADDDIRAALLEFAIAVGDAARTLRLRLAPEPVPKLPEPDDGPQTMTIPEAAEMLGISTNHAYKVIRETHSLGQIPAFQYAGRLRVSRKAVEDVVRTGHWDAPPGPPRRETPPAIAAREKATVLAETYSLKEAAELLGYKYNYAYELVRKIGRLGPIPVTRIGERIRVERKIVDRVVQLGRYPHPAEM